MEPLIFRIISVSVIAIIAFSVAADLLDWIFRRIERSKPDSETLKPDYNTVILHGERLPDISEFQIKGQTK